jgi:beta-galactosidase GanA
MQSITFSAEPRFDRSMTTTGRGIIRAFSATQLWKLCVDCALYLALGSLLPAYTVSAQQTSVNPLPRIDKKGAHPALIVDGAPFLMLGAQINNSSSWPSTMPAVRSTMEELGANTVEAPVYWETMEPEKGRFDFGQVDMLLTEARAHNKRLVLLWFGTWKNGSPGYTPAWMKRDPKRFPLVHKADGIANFSLSPFGEATLAADCNAFTALMQHIKSSDPQHTVIMVQIENETGVWGSMRDYGPDAAHAFAERVPDAVLRAMTKTGAKGSWSEVFGPDADEYFCAWSIARYVEKVAEAGKAVYPLPFYVNAALRDPLHPGGPLSFESGGPTYDVLPLWHAMAPSIDAIEPDIYMPEYDKYMAVLKQYSLPWNPFFVPETGNKAIYAHYFFSALGHGAFGWSPFGMDATGYSNYPLGAATLDAEELRPFRYNYEVVRPIVRELAEWIREGRVEGVAESPEKHVEQVALPLLDNAAPHWTAVVSYGLPSFWASQPAPGNKEPEGEALIVALGPDEFLVAGTHCRVDFTAAGLLKGKQRMWIVVEEGTYKNGEWQRDRIWNGDQTDYGLNFQDKPELLRVKLAAF